MNRSDIQRLFDYTEWANALALDAAAKLSEEQLKRDVQISHKSIFGTLQHMAGAEWIWLERWQGRSPSGTDVWPNWKAGTPNMEALRNRWQEVVQRRTRLVADLDDARLQQDVPFTLVNGSAGSLPLFGQMQHVVNHATMHRGQVIGMIRQLGVAPPTTDFLAYLRR